MFKINKSLEVVTSRCIGRTDIDYDTLDVNIRPMVFAINEGYGGNMQTYFSCEGHYDDEGEKGCGLHVIVKVNKKGLSQLFNIYKSLKEYDLSYSGFWGLSFWDNLGYEEEDGKRPLWTIEAYNLNDETVKDARRQLLRSILDNMSYAARKRVLRRIKEDYSTSTPNLLG